MEETPDRTLDAVERVRQIRDAQHERLDETLWIEKVGFFRERAEALVNPQVQELALEAPLGPASTP